MLWCSESTCMFGCSLLWPLIIIIVIIINTPFTHVCRCMLSLLTPLRLHYLSLALHVFVYIFGFRIFTTSSVNSVEDDSLYLEIFMIACKYAILILKLFEYVKSAVFLITVHLFSVWQPVLRARRKMQKANGLQSALRYINGIFSTYSLTHSLTLAPSYGRICPMCARINYMYDERYKYVCTKSCTQRYARYADSKKKSGTYYSSVVAHKTQINHQNEILSWNFSSFFSSVVLPGNFFGFAVYLLFTSVFSGISRTAQSATSRTHNVCVLLLWVVRFPYYHIVIMCLMFVLSSGVSSLANRYHLHKSRTSLHQC